MKKNRIDRFVFFLLVLWLIGIFATSLIHLFPEAIGFLFLWKHSYSFVCHQLPEKSFTIAGELLSVCARCSGIYFGATLGFLIAVFLPHIKHNIKGVTLILMSLILMSADVFLVLLDAFPYNKIRALATGTLVGITLISYIYPEIRNFLLEKRNNDTK